MEISFKLDLPPSSNEAYAVFRGRKILTRKAREWRNYASWAISHQAQSKRIDGKVSVSSEFIFPDFRRRDQSNYIKQLYDAITDSGIISDDSMIYEETNRKFIQKGVRCVTVKVKKLEESLTL